MGLVRTRISALQLQSILSWLLLFLLSPYSTIGALAKVSKDGETVVSSEPNSSNSTVKNDSNNKLKRALHGIAHQILRVQGITGIIVASLPFLLIVILIVRWWRTQIRTRSKAAATTTATATAVDPSSQAELAQKPEDIDSSTSNLELPRLLHDGSSSDSDLDKSPTSKPSARPLSNASTFVPVLSYPFKPGAGRPSRPVAVPAVGTRRASAGDTYRNSAYFTPTTTFPSTPTSRTTPKNTPFPHSRHISYINTANSPPPSPSQWLSRSPEGFSAPRPRLSLQEDKVMGYRKRTEVGATIDLSMSKKRHSQLSSVKHSAAR